MRTLKISLAIFVFSFIFIITGCQEYNSKKNLREKIDALRLEKTELQRSLEDAQADNKQAEKQIEVLTKLDEKVRLDSLYNLKQIKITKYTNLYDKDDDGQKEKLIVYIQPIDENFDAIKASGQVEVQLWDLNQKSDQAMLGQWTVTPQQLKELWFPSVFNSNYRLTFDVAGKIDKYEQPLTVKVKFTDYLRGKVFTEQKTIKP